MIEKRSGYLLGGAILFYAAVALAFWGYTVDDSFIAYRYAGNLAAGKGLVFNPGEPVEGYSSLLWVLLLSPAALAGKQGPLLWSKVLGIASATLLIALCGAWQKRRCPRQGVSILPWALASNLAVIAWSVAGLETMLYTLLLTGGLVALAEARDARVAAALLGLAAVSRPEGVLFCVVGAATFVLTRQVAGRRRWLVLAVLFGPLGAQLVFRCWYYGAWLPNPFYAKMGGGAEAWWKGLRYCREFILQWGPGAVLWLLVPIGMVRLWRRERRTAGVLGAALVAQVVFIVTAGGDWMKPFRFWVPVLPVLFALLAEGYEGLAERWWKPRPGRARLVRMVLLIGLVGANFYPWREVRDYTRTYAEGMQRTSVTLGRWLARRASPDDWAALGDVGALPYYSGLRVIDLYGLVNPDIARLAGPALYSEGLDAGAILARRPRYIVLESRAPGQPFEGLKPIDQKIYLEPRFRREYVLIQKAAFSPSEVTCLFERRETAGRAWESEAKA